MSLSFGEKKHKNYNCLASLWKNRTFCDAILTSRERNKTWPVHQVVLAAATPYFQSLFSRKNNRTRGYKRFVLEDVSNETLEVLLHWIYHSAAKLTTSNVQDVLIAADYYLLTPLVDHCVEFVIKNMTPENCIGLHRLSQYIHVPRLKQASFSFILDKFESIYKNNLQNSEFLQLKPAELRKYLYLDQLIVSSEESIWLAILKWISYNKKERLKNLCTLLRAVRLPLITKTYVDNEVLNHRYIKNNEDCERLIGRRTGSEDEPARARERWPRSLVLAVGGWTFNNRCETVESYDYKLKCWTKVPVMRMNEKRAYAGVCAIGQHVYVIGGSNHGEFYSSCEMYNLETMRWTQIASMCHRRCYVSVVELDGYIYAMGGSNGITRTNTAERYDPSKDQWTMIPCMSAVRSDASAATLNGLIYIVGGFDGFVIHSSAEVYNPQTQTWTYIPAMSRPRSGVSCVGHGGFIYAIGGSNSGNRLASGERYNPSWNSWNILPPMLNPRSNFGMVVLEDCIIVAGGFNGAGTILDVEYLDPNVMKWTPVAPLTTPKSALGMCVVQGIDNIQTIVNKRRYPRRIRRK